MNSTPPAERANHDDATNDDDLGIGANEELRTGDASMNADRGDGDGRADDRA